MGLHRLTRGLDESRCRAISLKTTAVTASAEITARGDDNVSYLIGSAVEALHDLAVQNDAATHAGSQHYGHQ